ncbi:MAG TPA: ubiquinone/menaquinone biosynthesis methyltransferase [Planctomycetota bacterium]|nr:ubiquinone/menaquinone biosynthesis methyltransferase [Planctomycetota bacterium]HRR81470.1 ubiquinone/menaquinone biosynthesis methyltransferase [Planctomycetota bacterium]HRT93747.1 ubiquinone/menaquinone biosynthesis methyltransferase [Planctomycetota bacterium]
MSDSLLPADANRRMFDGLAPRYDRLNRLLSLGLDRGWRRREAAALAPRDGEHYLDIGCGTGDVALEVLRRAPGCRVTGLDPSRQMLAVAAAKAARAGVTDRLTLVSGSVAALPFAEGVFHGITSAFALRSFADRARAFAEMRRVLAPGGRVSLLELTGPSHRLSRAGYWLYTRTFGALMCWLVCGVVSPYRFLCQSVDRFPAAGIPAELGTAGFQGACRRSLSGGIATLYLAHAP